MKIAVEIFGWLVLLLIAVGYAFNIYQEIMARIRNKYYIQEQKHIASSIDSVAYWFCEDKITEDLLHNMAAHVRRYGTIYPDALRNEWRLCRAAKTVTQVIK